MFENIVKFYRKLAVSKYSFLTCGFHIFMLLHDIALFASTNYYGYDSYPKGT